MDKKTNRTGAKMSQNGHVACLFHFRSRYTHKCCVKTNTKTDGLGFDSFAPQLQAVRLIHTQPIKKGVGTREASREIQHLVTHTSSRLNEHVVVSILNRASFYVSILSFTLNIVWLVCYR